MILKAKNHRVLIVLVVMVVVVILFVANRFQLVDKFKSNEIDKSRVVQCNEYEESITTQAEGKKICVKYPSDAGKECTDSNQCESGHCITSKPKAKSGSCFKSNYHQPCIFGYWTIEESQSKNDSEQPVPCFY
jgi:Tfp pilus assembly protein PilX